MELGSKGEGVAYVKKKEKKKKRCTKPFNQAKLTPSRGFAKTRLVNVRVYFTSLLVHFDSNSFAAVVEQTRCHVRGFNSSGCRRVESRGKVTAARRGADGHGE